MRITIHGFSQEIACQMQDVVDGKKVRIDATDLLILRWFTDFYPGMKKSIIDGKEYGWVTRKKMAADLPILGISEKSCAARLKKLVRFGLLDYRMVKDGGTYAMYTHGPRYESLVTVDGQTTTLGRSSALGVGGQAPYPQGGQLTYKDSGLGNSPSKDKGRGERFAPPTRDEVEAYAAEKGWRCFPTDRFIAYYESNGWMVGRVKMRSWRAAMSNWWHRDHAEDKPEKQLDPAVLAYFEI